MYLAYYFERLQRVSGSRFTADSLAGWFASQSSRSENLS